MRTREQFESYFIQEHNEFEEYLSEIDDKDSSLRTEFFDAAFGFCNTAFQKLKDKITWNDSNSLLIADCFLLKNSSSFIRLRTLAARFANIIPENKKTDFNSEVLRVKSEHSQNKSKNFQPKLIMHQCFNLQSSIG